jgi:hypothetical protein
MNAHLDDIASAVRRRRVVDAARETKTDIEVGWSYRLTQLLDTTCSFSVEGDRLELPRFVRCAVPETNFGTIAETFRAEQAEDRSSINDFAFYASALPRAGVGRRQLPTQHGIFWKRTVAATEDRAASNTRLAPLLKARRLPA